MKYLKSDKLIMEDKKLDEIKEYVKNLDSNISLSWDEWIGDLNIKLSSLCKSQKELDLVVDFLKKQNLGGITQEVLDKAVEYLEDENCDKPEWDK